MESYHVFIPAWFLMTGDLNPILYKPVVRSLLCEYAPGDFAALLRALWGDARETLALIGALLDAVETGREAPCSFGYVAGRTGPTWCWRRPR